MKYIYFCLFIISQFSFVGFSQTDDPVHILCPKIGFCGISIPDEINVPLVTDNPDGETITLTHPEQYITDIFANYTIYSFYKTSSSSTSRHYTIVFNDRNLLVDLQANVPETVFGSSHCFKTVPLENSVISFLDGKSFDFKKYFQEIEGGCPPDPNDSYPGCRPIDTPIGFNFTIKFDYEPATDKLIMKTLSPTSCENSFSIALKGIEAYSENQVKLWSVDGGFTISTPSSDNQNCHRIEEFFYQMFDIACRYYDLSGSIKIITDEINNTVTFRKPTSIFGVDYIYLEENSLSVSEHTFNSIKIYETTGSPYLNISNAKSLNFDLEIYTLSGQKVLNRTLYENKKINISNLNSGVYFINLYGSKSSNMVYKFLKR